MIQRWWVALLDVTADTPSGDVGALEDTRGTAKASLTTKLWTRVDFRFAVTARFDAEPAPRAAFALPYAAGFVPLADELDVITEAALIVNFL